MRRLSADELKLWAAVARTITPRAGQILPETRQDAPDAPHPLASPILPIILHTSGPSCAPQLMDHRRRRKIARRDLVEARLDLHGDTEAQARTALVQFVRTSVARGLRVVLVITGKGRGGEGILRKRLPEWLEGTDLSPYIGGYALAGQGHGGDGAYYLALKRKD